MNLFRQALSIVGFSLVCFSGFAQQPGGSAPGAGQLQVRPESSTDAANRLVLDVVVTDRSGKAVKGLEEKDFTVFDDGHSRKILSFRSTGGEVAAANVQPDEPPVKIILLIDEVNINFTRLAYERDQVKRFLLQNGGNLAHPVSMAFFSDAGAEVQNDTSRDGSKLLALFDQHETRLRSIRRSQGFYGAEERFQLSLNTLGSLAATEMQVPGRKIVVWISPGWPLLSGPNVQLSARNEAFLFSSIVSLSTALRDARITLYSVDPEGAGAALGTQEFYYREFLKPVALAKNAQAGNLALQVFAVHTGGLVFTASNDIAGQITRCVEDADVYYTLTVDAAPADRPDAYHALEVRVATPGLTARTRSGYYVQH
jgi:VWFA-related protein